MYVSLEYAISYRQQLNLFGLSPFLTVVSESFPTKCTMTCVTIKKHLFKWKKNKNYNNFWHKITYLQVLEQLLPTFFTGAKEFLQISGKAHIKHTRHKEPLSETTITKVIEISNFPCLLTPSIKKIQYWQKSVTTG